MISITYGDERIKKSIEELESKDPEIYRHVMNAFLNIREDTACGIKIPQRLIPKEWIKRFSINNLYKYNLPNAWRLFYSLSGSRIEIIAIILGCFNHKDYERIFSY
ncbi:MAG: hypothetical protein KKB21_01155 [Nanoarchaeota archaeon]|nr:hypothetical protein [Nanoarchaeota archaeon]MBU4086164.1 hypothetical protein [Nanoarchaeota archaeon]